MKESANGRNTRVRTSADLMKQTSLKKPESIQKKTVSSNHDIVSSGSWNQPVNARQSAAGKPTLTASTLKKMRQAPNEVSSLHKIHLQNLPRDAE